MVRKKGIFHSYALLGILLFFLVLLGKGLYSELQKQSIVQDEIDRLEQELAKMNQNNQNLTAFMDFLKTDQFIEKQARTKFGYKKPGEKVLVIQADQIVDTSLDMLSSDHNQVKNEENNIVRWVRYFFSNTYDTSG